MEHLEDREGKRTRNRLIDGIVFAVLLAAASAVTLALFYRQTMGNPSSYHSDMKAYILEMQGLESGYSFPYPVFFKLSAFLHLFVGPELAVALATMLLNSLGMAVTKLAFNYIVLEDLEGCFRKRGKDGGRDRSWLAGVCISLAAVSLFFISMLYPPKGIYLPGIRHHYLGVFTSNPFHNATYMAARPFAILAFLWYVKLLGAYEKGIPERGGRRGRGRKAHDAGETAPGAPKAALGDYVLFSVFLLLATMTKPSFTLVMVSTAGLIMLYRLVRGGFRNFVPTVMLGLCFVPTFIDLLYQYQGVFVHEQGVEGGLGFGFGKVWANYCGNIPLAVCLAVGFPLLVLVLNRKEWKKNTLFAFSWQMYLVGFAEAFFLYEKGFREVDFNFSWGYMCGIFFCHFSALLVLLRVTAGKIKGRRGEGAPAGAEGCAARRIDAGVLLLQWAAYLWHVACGLYYFGRLMGGAMYY